MFGKIKYYIGTALDWARTNKTPAIISGLLVIFVGSVVGYATLRPASSRAETAAKQEVASENKDASAEIKQDSKALDFRLPLAEDVMATISKQEALDGELNDFQKLDIINDEYGEKAELYTIDGTLPSKNYTINQNKAIIDMKKPADGKHITPEVAWQFNNSEYILNGDDINVFTNYKEVPFGYTLADTTVWFNTSDLLVGGFNVMDSKSDVDSHQNNIDTFNDYQDYSDITKSIVADSENLIAVSFYVRPTKDLKVKAIHEILSNTEIGINGNKALSGFEILEIGTRKGNESLEIPELFGTIAQTYSNEKVTLTSSGFLNVIMYASGESLKDTNNELSIAGNIYKLKPVTQKQTIDLSTSYTEDEVK